MYADGKLGVFGLAPFGPAAGVFEGLFSYEAHRAYGEPGVAFVKAGHDRFEEVFIFPVAHPLVEAPAPFPVVVRGLDESHFRVFEIADEAVEEIRLDLVVAVHDAYDLDFGRRVLEREVERPCLCAFYRVYVEESEPLAEPFAVRLDGLPEVGVFSVVVYDHDFEIRIIEPRYAVERCYYHVRRLGIGRHLEANPRVAPEASRREGAVGPVPLYLAEDFPLLESGYDSAEKRDEEERVADVHEHARYGAHVNGRDEPEPQTIPKRERREYVTSRRRPAIVKFLSTL